MDLVSLAKNPLSATGLNPKIAPAAFLSLLSELACFLRGFPRACAVGCILPPLRGLTTDSKSSLEGQPEFDYLNDRQEKQKGSLESDPLELRIAESGLECGLDLEAPSFQKRLGDVLGVLIAASPLPQPCRPQILVGGELVLAHNLFKFGDRGGNGTDRLGLTPIRISASLRHGLLPFHSGE